jgi:hypothetical protein
MATNPLAGARDPASVARELNAQIFVLEARLDDESFLSRNPERHLIGLMCECGCMEIVTSTRARYEKNGGAWLEGHEPRARP